MDADALRDFTLQARKILITEVSEQLEGIYGLLPDGRFEPVGNYPALEALPECAATRKHLETFLADEQAAGLDRATAWRKLAKEVAFTWLNRLVAFKMLEARKLLRQTISQQANSNGFKMWLTESGNEQHLRDYEAGDFPKDARQEGPRDRAYRQFLLAQCRRLSAEIRVLFDPDNLPSALCPRPPVLAQLGEMLNAGDLADAWAPGNEETIGWVYQFFIEEEKKAVFDKLYKNKQKIQQEDIAAATQIFTPRWIVKCLVHNTMGRMWLQMHPNSELAEKLDYLVPLEGQIPAVPLKLASQITLLDPACGTMHFGLVAFDLLVEMYREELTKAGQPGWPAQASVQRDEDIPAAIIANNLHGIDIDLRAVQLSALTLLVKAKMVNPRARLTDSNLACAETRMILGPAFTQFLDRLGRPIYRRILTALSKRLEHADQLGSLLRPDEDVRKLVEEERKKYHREGRQPDLFGWSAEQFGSEAGQREFWETLEVQVFQAIQAFAQEEADKGHDASFFVGEAAKGLRLLDLLGQRYDLVMTNPPYMTNRNMNPLMGDYLKKDFPAGKRDLYAAFVQRCTELLADGGRLGMITQQSFMFISSYEPLRQYLRERITIETLPHVGPRAFAEVSGEKVNTTLLVFRREPRESLRQEAIGTYFRLAKEPDADVKRTRFEQALANLRAGQPDALVFCYRQADFDIIPGNPWVYWISDALRSLFGRSRKLGDVAQLRAGMHGGDLFRFGRYWWEVGVGRVARGCRSRDEAFASAKKWVPYMKGGTFRRWWGNQEWVIAFDEPHYTILSFSGNKLPSREYYFRAGVTWTEVATVRFNARLSPGGFVFDAKGSTGFADDIPLVLGLLNSSFTHYVLTLLNPTVSFQAGDLARVPIPDRSSETLRRLVNSAVKMCQQESTEGESTYDFLSPPIWRDGASYASTRQAELRTIEGQIDEEAYRLYGIADEDRAAIEAELAEGGADQAETDDDGETSEDKAAEEGAAEEPALSQEDLAQRWLSYAVGIVLGRFEPGVEGGLGCGNFTLDVATRLRKLADPDGIMVQDEGHRDDLANRTLEAVRIMLGEDTAWEVIQIGTGKQGPAEEVLRKYLEGPFFKEHIRLYRKRPVYWLLQSPRKKYGVWVFHERLTGDSLFRIQREYVDPKIKLLEGHLVDLRKARDAAAGRDRRAAEKEIDGLEDVLADVREFVQRIDAAIKRGYRPHIDDGVLLNMAPLWGLVPSWQAEPKKAWQALERGDYDWAQTAMDYWPDRVRQKCKTNKSFAIAHGLA